MRIMRTITQVFDRCAAARGKASLVVCIAALIFSPLPAHAETAALQYDNNGNIIQRTTPQGTTTYTYDPLNRLKSEAGPAKTQSFTYDENGNRLSDGAGSYTYEPVSNRMSTRLGLAVTFDAAGRLTADGTGRTFAYNQAGQLYQVRQGGTLIATYYYDGNGLRSRKVTTASAPQGAQTVIYGYDEQGHLIAELSGTNAPIRSYFWQGDIPLAQMEHQAGDKILYFVTDHLNTPRAAMDETGKVVWRWESDAFGSTAPNEDTDSDGNLTTVNLRKLGEYADVESGLYYNTFRYLDPGKGRYTQSDPIGLAGGINPYAHVENNPLRFTDQLGLDAYMCTAPLHALGDLGKWVYKEGTPLLHHQYICVKNGKTTVCGGQDRAGGPYSPGTPSKDDFNANQCKKKDDRSCVDKCLVKAIQNPKRPYYGLAGPGTNCQEWATESYSQCVSQCQGK